MYKKEKKRLGPNLEPEMAGVYSMDGLRNGMDTIHAHRLQVRERPNLPITVAAVLRAVNYVSTQLPRFQVRARPS